MCNVSFFVLLTLVVNKDVFCRPDTNWTSWITFAVSGTMQCILLIMCFAWKRRQSKLGIDDFGHPLHEGDEETYEHEHEGEDGVVGAVRDDETEGGEETPLLAKRGEGERKSVWTSLKGAFGRR